MRDIINFGLLRFCDSANGKSVTRKYIEIDPRVIS
jgi:hypothetical protein